jgi:hypothetical protein
MLFIKPPNDTFIKNDELIDLIKQSKFNPTYLFESFGLEKLAEIFNRFKPLFLAYKNRAPKPLIKFQSYQKSS